ncbi:MAG: toll/interleukin-1 receptor domain-containing protein [Clostridia bacterium]|nr:toll/interleukin-1 receptor domain-containing protein [Clostridia bacterium]
MEKHIFISYSTKDRQIAFDMVDFFESRGVGCYIAPRDIEPGGSYASKLTRAICNSKAIVLVASSAINESEHILNEVDIIVSENKYFVPFFIEEFEMNYDYRYYLGRKQRIIAYPGDPRNHFEKLLDALSSVIHFPESRKPEIKEAAPIKVADADNTQKIFNYIPHRGIMINPEDQQRNVSFRTDTFIGMMGGIYNEVLRLSDEEHAKTTFRQSGYACGYSFAQRLNSHWDLSASGASLYEEKLRKWCQFDSDVGWGKFDISIDVNEETGDFRGELTISECFIVDIKDKRHICEFVKGYCDGVIETLLGVKVELVCRTCPLKNRFKNACVFDILISEE